MLFEITRASHAGAAFPARHLVSYSLSIKMHRAFLAETNIKGTNSHNAGLWAVKRQPAWQTGIGQASSLIVLSIV